MNTAKCLGMLINVESGLILCSVCVCPRTCSVKVKSGDSRVFLAGLCLLPRDSERILLVVNLFSYGLTYTRTHSLSEWDVFLGSSLLPQPWPPDSKVGALENGLCQPCPNEWINSGRPGRTSWPRANFWEQRLGRIAAPQVLGFLWAAQCKVGTGFPVRAPRAAWEEVCVALVQRSATGLNVYHVCERFSLFFFPSPFPPPPPPP